MGGVQVIDGRVSLGTLFGLLRVSDPARFPDDCHRLGDQHLSSAARLPWAG
jgi:hypothetical protein